jgi:hypothetical protein
MTFMDKLFKKYRGLMPDNYHVAFAHPTWVAFEEKHWAAIRKYYEAHEKSFDPLGIHGVAHIERCLIIANVLLEELTTSQPASEKRLEMLIAVAFHDAGREENGLDIWESVSARLCMTYLINAGFDADTADFAWSLIIKKGNSIYHDLLHDVDAIEITRLIRKGDFDWKHLRLPKRHDVDKKELSGLITSLIDFAIKAQDNVIFNFKSK